ncbi:hypothetical protein ACFVW8_26460 [Streptomyces sp. NPDC058221]|uniref:hypothetical protein n=1 Tax=Streptomyces sp. NPDC058221 TaxID=3346388 RepID=UPI0036E43AC9
MQETTRLKTFGLWVSALGLAALLPALVALWIGDSVEKLLTGEPATVHTVTRCVEGGAQLPPSHCDGSWTFADGRTASGEITGDTVSAGDTIFAGAGWAYDSTSGLHRQIWGPVVIFGAGVVTLLVTWQNYRRNRNRPDAELSPG